MGLGLANQPNKKCSEALPTYYRGKGQINGFPDRALCVRCFRKSKYGYWVSKLPEQEMFRTLDACFSIKDGFKS